MKISTLKKAKKAKEGQKGPQEGRNLQRQIKEEKGRRLEASSKIQDWSAPSPVTLNVRLADRAKVLAGSYSGCLQIFEDGRA